MNNFFKSRWAKLGGLFIVLGLLFLFISRLNIDFSGLTIEKFKGKIESYGIWAPLVYIAIYQIPAPFRPAALLSASAGVIWGLEGFIYLIIAANTSAIAEFLIARYAARRYVERLVAGRFERIDKAIEKYGFWTVLLFRLVPNFPWDIQNLGLGLTRVRFRDYVLATFLGIIPASFALVYFGSSFISVITDPGNFWKILVAFALFGGLYWLQHYLRTKKTGKVEELTGEKLSSQGPATGDQ